MTSVRALVVAVMMLSWSTVAYTDTIVDEPARRSPLTLSQVRLDPGPPHTEDSAVLTFELSNQSSATISDVLFAVSIVEDDHLTRGRTPSRLLAGTFAVRVKAALDPGYTAEYEMLLRHLSPTCICAARVRVLSFRSSSDAEPHSQAAAVKAIEKP